MLERIKTIGRKEPIVGLVLSLALLAVVLGVGFYLLPLNDRWRLLAAVPGPIRRTGRIMIRLARDLPYLSYQFKDHNLPVYDLRVDRDDWARLESNIPDANENLLTDEYKVPVPVTLRYDGQEYEGKIRYRGGSKVHWLWPKKSYRINFKKSQLFRGEEEIDLIIPYDRQYVVEQFQMYRARKLGLTAPNTRFVVVTVDGRRPAVYWEAELPGASMLERQGLSGDANFYVGEDLETGSLYDSVTPWKKATSDVRFAADDRSDLAALLDLLNTADDKEFSQRIFSLLDKENFYNWSTHALLAKSNHQDWAHNMRLYFQPSLGKFLILPWDVGVLYNYQYVSGYELFEQSWNRLSNRILTNPVFMQERNQRLWEYVRDEKNIQDDLSEYDKLFADVRVPLYQDRIRRFDNAYVDREAARFRQVLADQFYFLRDLFVNAELQASALPESPKVLRVTLETKSLSPLALERIEVIGAKVRNTLDQPLCFGSGMKNDCEPLVINPRIESVRVPEPADAIRADEKDFVGYENVFQPTTLMVEFESASDLKRAMSITFYLRNLSTGLELTHTVPLAL